MVKYNHFKIKPQHFFLENENTFVPNLNFLTLYNGSNNNNKSFFSMS